MLWISFYFDICSSRNITIYSLVSDYRACSNETKKKKIRVDNPQCGFHVLLITIIIPRESFFGKILMLPVYFCKTPFFPNAFFSHLIIHLLLPSFFIHISCIDGSPLGGHLWGGFTLLHTFSFQNFATTKKYPRDIRHGSISSFF